VPLSLKVKNELDKEEIWDLDVHADKIVTQADNFSWDQLVLDSDEGNVV